MALPIRRTDGTQQYSPDTGELLDRGDPGAQQAQYISKDNNVLYNINGERLDSMGHPTGTFTNIQDLDYFSDRFPPQTGAGAVGGKVGDKTAEVKAAEKAFRQGERGDYTKPGSAPVSGKGAAPAAKTPTAPAAGGGPVVAGTGQFDPQGASARPLARPFSVFTSPTGRRLIIPRGDMTGLVIRKDAQGNQFVTDAKGVEIGPSNPQQDLALQRAGERGLGTEGWTPPERKVVGQVVPPNQYGVGQTPPGAPAQPGTGYWAGGRPLTGAPPAAGAIRPQTGQPTTGLAGVATAAAAPAAAPRGYDLPGAQYPQPAPSQTSFGYQAAQPQPSPQAEPQRGPGVAAPQRNPWNGGPFGPQREPDYTYQPPPTVSMMAAPPSQAESVGRPPIADPASGLYDTQMQRQALAARQEDAYNLGSAPSWTQPAQTSVGERLAADPRFDQEVATNYGLRTDFNPMTLGSSMTQAPPVQASMYPGANTPYTPWNGVDATSRRTLPEFEKPYQGGSYWNPPMPGGGGWGGNW